VAGLAVAVFACLGAARFRRRHTAGSPFAAAILAAFAAHSTFDFLWHIPVAAAAARHGRGGDRSSTNRHTKKTEVTR
jgi:hypothetical protein